MSWFTAHAISIVTFLPLLGAMVIAFVGRDRGSLIRRLALVFSLLTFLGTLGLYWKFDVGRAGMQFEEFRLWIKEPQSTTTWGSMDSACC